MLTLTMKATATACCTTRKSNENKPGTPCGAPGLDTLLDKMDTSADQEAAKLLIFVSAYGQAGLIIHNRLIGLPKKGGPHRDDIT